MDFKEWIKELREASRSAVVLVEGKKDEEALKKFFVKNVMTLAGKRFSDLPDLLEKRSRKVILLFDLDEGGEKILSKVKEVLQEQGFETEEKFREALKDLRIIHIEDLNEEGRKA